MVVRLMRPACWLSFVLLALCDSDARAGFIGYYAPANFTLTNNGGGFDPGTGDPTANGHVVFPDLLTLVLTGTNDGSNIPGYTDVTIPALASGVFQFHFVFNTLDIPQTQFACFLVGSSPSCDPFAPDQFFLADTDGTSGSVTFAVTAGELIGFRVGGDGQGHPGVLTIDDFSAPVPEPGTFQLLLIAAAVTAGGAWRTRARVRRSQRPDCR